MRRVHVPDLRPGLLTTDPAQARHLRSVLRLRSGDRVQAFDDAGQTADAIVEAVEPAVTLRVDGIAPPRPAARVTVASAVPKGDRADWMIEKLSELGVSRFVPLRTTRSVVHPEGAGKLDRWKRIAVEAAKQSRRPGVMGIEPLAHVAEFLPTVRNGVYFSTRPNIVRWTERSAEISPTSVLLIGPEGGWTEDEVHAFDTAGLTAAGLGRTILRIETAAVLAAGLHMLSAEAG